MYGEFSVVPTGNDGRAANLASAQRIRSSFSENSGLQWGKGLGFWSLGFLGFRVLGFRALGV